MEPPLLRGEVERGELADGEGGVGEDFAFPVARIRAIWMKKRKEGGFRRGVVQIMMQQWCRNLRTDRAGIGAAAEPEFVEKGFLCAG